MNKYTPAPWFLDEVTLDISNADRTCRIAAVAIPSLHGSAVNSDIDTAEANARVIQLAPELLQSLLNLLDVPDLNYDEIDPTSRQRINESLVIIAKVQS